MTRLLALAVIAGGLAATAVPAAAAPYCGTYAGVMCTPDGARSCIAWVAKPDTCVRP